MRGGGSSGECHSRVKRAASACCTGIWEHISCVIMLSAARSRVSSDCVAGGRNSRHDTMRRMCRLGQWDAAAARAADGDAGSRKRQVFSHERAMSRSTVGTPVVLETRGTHEDEVQVQPLRAVGDGAHLEGSSGGISSKV